MTNKHSFDPALAEHLQALRDIAREIGAICNFTLRGVQTATLLYVPEGSDEPIQFEIAPGHPTLFLAIFVTRDGREPGIES